MRKGSAEDVGGDGEWKIFMVIIFLKIIALSVEAHEHTHLLILKCSSACMHTNLLTHVHVIFCPNREKKKGWEGEGLNLQN